MPTFSSNDRSRWCTVRALVDEGTWVIGHRHVAADGSYRDEGIVFQDGWTSLDKVLLPTPRQGNGETVFEFCSSKPPLLSALAAGEYWLLKQLFGWSITAQPNLVVKTIVLTFNAVPFALALVMLKSLLEQLGTTDFGRIFIFSTACFGTFLTTFATTLNNHTPAAVTALAALYPLLKGADGKIDLSPVAFFLSGLFTGLTVCLELPAAALAAVIFVVFVWHSRSRTFLFFVPAAILPIAAELFLNHSAVHQWAPVQSGFGSPLYDYAGSYWAKPRPGVVKHGIDWARMHESIWDYAFNVLIGHHGLFSLTPVWILAFAGMVAGIRRPGTIPRFFAPSMLLVSVVVVGFYVIKTDNYGGWTSGLRWLIWLTTPWLIAMLPASDWLGQRRWGRWLGYCLLAVSVFSANFPAGNPWRHPWLYQLLEAHGMIHY
jgi:hypothetical protein